MSEHNHTPFETLVIDSMRTLVRVVNGMETRLSAMEGRVSPVNDTRLIDLVKAFASLYYRDEHGYWLSKSSHTGRAIEALLDYVESLED